MSEEFTGEENEAPTIELLSYLTESGLPVGPKSDVEYPLSVLYCGNCGLPTEVLLFIYQYYSQIVLL